MRGKEDNQDHCCTKTLKEKRKNVVSEEERWKNLINKFVWLISNPGGPKPGKLQPLRPVPEQIDIPVHSSRADPFTRLSLMKFWGTAGRHWHHGSTMHRGRRVQAWISEESHGESAVCRWRAARISFTRSHLHSQSFQLRDQSYTLELLGHIWDLH